MTHVQSLPAVEVANKLSSKWFGKIKSSDPPVSFACAAHLVGFPRWFSKKALKAIRLRRTAGDVNRERHFRIEGNNLDSCNSIVIFRESVYTASQ